MPHLRLATWNTWKNGGDYALRLDAMTETLCEISADVLFLQECVHAPEIGIDTAGHLSRQRGLGVTFLPARRKLRRFDGEMVQSASGLALLTNARVLHCEGMQLPTSDRGGERVALLQQIELASSTLWVANVHFSHVGNEIAIRRQQFERVLQRLSALAKPGDPVFIGGDFNCARGDTEWETARTPVGWQLRDSFADLALDTATHPIPFREEARGRRIDFLVAMVHEHQYLRRPRVLDGGVCGLDRAQSAGVHGSDHALVWADWELPDVD